ncbi:transporter substrate-binding domain-containing protein [Modicisalibacter coralii]|uniref:transporter substrate-binding domain-containing protein n=1 Tax=Modicisalibacter coralii TaxID=2304602 RepID=UPI00100BFA3A|nr:transporter substrate-binding domain-containing protein [Halomonas coralii]
MKKLLASTLIGLSVMATGAQADDTVRIAVDVPYEPFEYKTPDGTLEGFDIDLGNALCKEVGVQCEWVTQPWDGIIPGLLARKYDAIMSSMVITPERERKVLFTHPYSATPRAWIAPADSKIDIHNKQQLEGRSVGVQRATLQDRYVTELYGDVLDVRRYDDIDDVITDMRAGRLDLAFMNYPIAEKYLEIDSGKSEFKRISGFIKGPEKFFGKGVGIAFRKRDKELVERFNEALATIRDNGTYDRIMKKYFRYDISP